MIKSRLVSTFLRFHRLLGCSLVDLTKFSCPRLSVELDPMIGVWEIGCSLAASRPIVLALCVRVPKRLYYEDLVVFWWWIVPVWAEMLESQRYESAKMAKIRPSEVVFSVHLP